MRDEQEDTAEYGARDDADPKGMQRVVDELLEKARFCVWMRCSA